MGTVMFIFYIFEFHSVFKAGGERATENSM